MSFIGNMFNASQGSGFQAQAAPITQTTTAGQVNAAQNQAQSGINQQQNFVNALGAQNGLANQSNVFNQQQGLANQLQGVANGTGPNPAQAQLNQNTATNTANQAALMAGQRGASSNAGLIARQAAMQGAANQQNAVGQAATLEAQQQLGAMAQLGQQQANLQNVAGQQIGNQQAGLGQLNAYQQAQQGALQGAVNTQNQLGVQQQGNINSTNAGIAGSNIGAQQGLVSGILGGAGALLAANGGAIPMMAEGGEAKVVGHLIRYAKGGKVPALVSPGETYLPPNKVKEVAKGKDPLKVGERIPGKPKHPGNDYRNDTVEKTLKSGGIVIPNSVMQSTNPHESAHKFVTALLAKQNMNRRK